MPPRRRGQVFRQQDDFFDDRRDAGEELGRDGDQAIDERLQMADLAEVVREEIAGLFAERFGDADEVLDVKTALIRLQPGELRRRNLHASGDLGLQAALRFAELPEDATVHAGGACTPLAS